MKKWLSMALLAAVVVNLSGCIMLPSTGNSSAPTLTPNQSTNEKKAISDTETQETVSLEDKVVYDAVDAPTLCLMKFTNNNDVPVEVEVNFVFEKDEIKAEAGYGHLYCLAGGETGYISMKKPTDENSLPIEGYTTKYTVTIHDSGIFDEKGSFKNNITVEDSQNGNEITITVKNRSDEKIDNVGVIIVYYLDNVPVWTDDYSYEIAAKGENYYTFSEPHYYDVGSTDIPFDRYEIFVNDAFNYK